MYNGIALDLRKLFVLIARCFLNKHTGFNKIGYACMLYYHAATASAVFPLLFFLIEIC